MKKHIKKGFILLLTLSLALGISPNFTNAAEIKKTDEYEIYPLPQSITYNNGEFNITDHINIVYETDIDEITREFLQETVEDSGRQFSISTKVVEDKTNIIVGIRGSDQYIHNYFADGIPYNTTIFQNTDAYVLNVNTRQEKGTIAILAEDTNSAFYSIATLKTMFSSVKDGKFVNTLIEDYADVKWRGFIEGFYGIPWTNKDRISLMEYGSQFKMNSYIFAPKDDPYHNSKWRTLYPEKELEGIKELVEAGKRTKVEFVWAIHPGMSAFKFNDYENEFNTLIAKLEQLYSIGVRQFGVFFDDVSGVGQEGNHIRLMNDINRKFNKVKEGTDDLIFCTPYYNKSWSSGEDGLKYLRAMSGMDPEIHIMWTGDSVIGGVNKASMEWLKQYTNRDVYMWFNFPVTDYLRQSLFLGRTPMLENDGESVIGLVSNPMDRAEASKIALFSIADYSWNIGDFNSQQSWEDSFKYIAPEVEKELYKVAQNISNAQPNGHGTVLEESEYVKEDLALFLKTYKAGESVGAIGNKLVNEFKVIQDSIMKVKEETQNRKLAEEIDPWITGLLDVARACEEAVEATLNLENGNKEAAWANYARAAKSLELAETRRAVTQINGGTEVVRAGSKRLKPFAKDILLQLKNVIIPLLNPEYDKVNAIPMTSYSGGDPENMVDNNPATHSYFKTVGKIGDYIGVDLGREMKVVDIELLQGANGALHDKFYSGTLEYSSDNKSWAKIGDFGDVTTVAADSLGVMARYIRYRCTGLDPIKNDRWTGVREFTVNKVVPDHAAFTNADSLKAIEMVEDGLDVYIAPEGNIALKSNEYLGLKLKELSVISSKDIQITNVDENLVVEYSVNNFEWKNISNFVEGTKARYFRVINKGIEDANLDIDKFSVRRAAGKINLSASMNFGGAYEGSINNIIDGDRTTKIWTNSGDDVGKYMQVDIGTPIPLYDITLVAPENQPTDIFHNANIEVSLDGKKWDVVKAFTGADYKLQVPYQIIETNNNGGVARYIRVITREKWNNQSPWIKVNEIEFNQKQAPPVSQDDYGPYQGSPIGEFRNITDDDIGTFFTPIGDDVAGGHLTYTVTDSTNLNKLIILQDPDSISDATVKVKDENGECKTIGNLDEGVSEFDTSMYNHILEIKLEWGAVKPIIYEMFMIEGLGTEEPGIPSESPALKLIAPESIKSGESFEVVAKLDGITDPIYAQDTIVEYDQDLFTYNGVTAVEPNSVLPDDQSIKHEEENGIVRVLGVVLEDGGLTQDGEVFKFNFSAKETMGATLGSIKAKMNVATIEEDHADLVLVGESQKYIKITPQNGTGNINKANLESEITIAKELRDNAQIGSEAGMYPVGAKDMLDKAIEIAQNVVDTATTQDAIDEALINLIASIREFKDSRIEEDKLITADVNGDGEINIADLALVAYYYKTASTDENWIYAKKVNVVNDDLIDILDIVFIARKILGL